MTPANRALLVASFVLSALALAVAAKAAFSDDARTELLSQKAALCAMVGPQGMAICSAPATSSKTEPPQRPPAMPPGMPQMPPGMQSPNANNAHPPPIVPPQPPPPPPAPLPAYEASDGGYRDLKWGMAAAEVQPKLAGSQPSEYPAKGQSAFDNRVTQLTRKEDFLGHPAAFDARFFDGKLYGVVIRMGTPDAGECDDKCQHEIVAALEQKFGKPSKVDGDLRHWYGPATYVTLALVPLPPKGSATVVTFYDPKAMAIRNQSVSGAPGR